MRRKKKNSYRVTFLRGYQGAIQARIKAAEWSEFFSGMTQTREVRQFVDFETFQKVPIRKIRDVLNIPAAEIKVTTYDRPTNH